MGLRLIIGGLGAAIAVAVTAWLAFGWDWLHGFGLAGENQSRTSYMSIPITTARLTGLDPDTSASRLRSSSSPRSPTSSPGPGAAATGSAPRAGPPSPSS